MAALDLEEQEKIAELKAWWNRYGGALTSVALIAALAFAGYSGWQWYTRNQAAQAATAYEALQGAIRAKDMGKVKDAAGVLFDKYSSTAYAQMAALEAAKSTQEAGDGKTAKAELQWATEHAKDTEYRLMARLRLAGLLLDENANDAALTQLNAGGDMADGFKAAFADRRGDVYVAQKKLAEARKEYEAALAGFKASPETANYAKVVQLKLDDLSSVLVTSTVAINATATPDADAAPLSTPAASAPVAPVEEKK